MSHDPERDRRLDDELRALTRRVVGTAPPAVPYEQLAARHRPRRARVALAGAAAVLVVAAIAAGVAVQRWRSGTVVSSLGGELILLEPLGPTELAVGDRSVPGVRFAIEGDRSISVALTAEELCAQAGGDPSPSCTPRAAPVHYAFVSDADRSIVVAGVPEDTAVAVITVGGRRHSQQPVDGVLAFVLPADVFGFKIEAHDTSGRLTATVEMT